MTNAAAAANPPPGAARYLPLLVPLAFLIVAVPMILAQHDRSRGRFDQINYHQPAILKIAEELPTPDLSDSLSATTPGYHLALAVVARTISTDTRVLQLAGAMFTVAFLALLARSLSTRAPPVIAATLTATVTASLYVFSSGVFLLPDNAAWLAVLTVLLLALRPVPTVTTYLAAGAVFFALVLTRQSHAWAAALVWTTAALGNAKRLDAPSLLRSVPQRTPAVLIAVAATLPAFALLGWFVSQWGGLTPPFFQGVVQGANPASPAIILTQIGVIAVFHAPFWLPPLWRSVRADIRPALGVIVVASVVSLVPATTYSIEAGRWSGIWNIADRFPDVAGHANVFVVAGAIGGSLALLGWLGAAPARDRWVYLAALAAFMAASSVNHNAWPRYHEPLLLMLTAMLSATAAGREPATGFLASAGRVVGIVLLVVALSAVTFVKVTEGKGQRIQRTQPEFDRALTDLWPRAWVEGGPPEGLAAPEGQ